MHFVHVDFGVDHRHGSQIIDLHLKCHQPFSKVVAVWRRGWPILDEDKQINPQVNRLLCAARMRRIQAHETAIS
jgi:hypothetical protein